jgi:lipoyl-dependent peroxiredoxin
MDRGAMVTWIGSGSEGHGTIRTDSGSLVNTPFSARARFELEGDRVTGTNPEELLGAAHAGCFTMALAFRLAAAGHPATELRTEARVRLVKAGQSWTIPQIRLHCTGKVPGISPEQFMQLAADAKAHCPISEALRPEITLTASLA